MTMLTQGQQGGQAGDGSANAGNQGGHNTTDWRAALPEELRAEKVFESIKGKDAAEVLPVLAKNYVHAQRLIGSDKLVLPTDKSTPEEIKAFRTKLGVPEKPEEYGFRLPEGLTEQQVDKERLDTWRKEMHEAGIPKSAAERLITKYLSDEFAAIQNQTKAREQELNQFELKVKEEFGVRFDEKLNFARLAVKEFGGAELADLLETTGLGSHPAVVRTMAKIGEQLADHKARNGEAGRFSAGMSKENAQAALTAFNRDKEKQAALWDPRHIHHDAAVKERADLFKAAFPSDSDDQGKTKA